MCTQANLFIHMRVCVCVCMYMHMGREISKGCGHTLHGSQRQENWLHVFCMNAHCCVSGTSPTCCSGHWPVSDVCMHKAIPSIGPRYGLARKSATRIW